MYRFSLALALVGAFLSGSFLMNSAVVQAEDKPEPKVRGFLYPKWKEIGLDKDQIQKIYKIQGTHRGQIEKLEAQIRDLKKKERVEAETVLTPAQKDRLKELLTGDTGKDKTTPKDKPTDKTTDKPIEKKDK